MRPSYLPPPWEPLRYSALNWLTDKHNIASKHGMYGAPVIEFERIGWSMEGRIGVGGPGGTICFATLVSELFA